MNWGSYRTESDSERDEESSWASAESAISEFVLEKERLDPARYRSRFCTASDQNHSGTRPRKMDQNLISFPSLGDISWGQVGTGVNPFPPPS
jgi:hypothetical protein